MPACEVVGGAVTLEADSIVNGNVVLIGGTVDMEGTVNGDFVGMGGRYASVGKPL